MHADIDTFMNKEVYLSRLRKLFVHTYRHAYIYNYTVVMLLRCYPTKMTTRK